MGSTTTQLKLTAADGKRYSDLSDAFADALCTVERGRRSFPTIGNIFSNHWKNCENFFQSLENWQKIFPIIGKFGAIFPTIGKLFSTHWKICGLPMGQQIVKGAGWGVRLWKNKGFFEGLWMMELVKCVVLAGWGFWVVDWVLLGWGRERKEGKREKSEFLSG